MAGHSARGAPVRTAKSAIRPKRILPMAPRQSSFGVARVLAVEHLLHLLEMREGGLGVVVPVLGRTLGDRVGHDVERLARGVGEDQRLAGALEIVEFIERLGDAGARDQPTWV